MSRLKHTPYNCFNANCRNPVSAFKMLCEYCQISPYGEVPKGISVQLHTINKDEGFENIFDDAKPRKRMGRPRKDAK